MTAQCNRTERLINFSHEQAAKKRRKTNATLDIRGVFKPEDRVVDGISQKGHWCIVCRYVLVIFISLDISNIAHSENASNPLGLPGEGHHFVRILANFDLHTEISIFPSVKI